MSEKRITLDDLEKRKQRLLRKIDLQEKKIGETFHVYDQFGKHFLKTTHWFYMTCSSGQELIPQVEEHITEIKWVKTIDIREPIKNTYPSIKNILSNFCISCRIELIFSLFY